MGADDVATTFQGWLEEVFKEEEGKSTFAIDDPANPNVPIGVAVLYENKPRAEEGLLQILFPPHRQLEDGWFDMYQDALATACEYAFEECDLKSIFTAIPLGLSMTLSLIYEGLGFRETGRNEGGILLSVDLPIPASRLNNSES
jgi:hypothetical protein